MTEGLVQKWNEEHARIPKDKTQSAYAQLIEKEFSRNSQIADLGSGIGADAIYFLQQGHTVIAVDISPVALEQSAQKAAELGLHLVTRQAEIGEQPLPLEDNSLDAIYSRLALHYFDQTQTKMILTQLYSKLKPGGKAFITLKSPGDEKETTYLKQTAKEVEPGVFDDQGQIKSRFTIEQLQEMLNAAGIDLFEVAPYIEDLSNRGDVTKSGNQQMLLNEIRITKPK